MKCTQPPLNAWPTHFGKRCGQRTALRNKCILHHTGTGSKKVMACAHFPADTAPMNHWLLLHTPVALSFSFANEVLTQKLLFQIPSPRLVVTNTRN